MSLRAEDLMVGDWVQYRDTNIQVTSLYCKKGSNEVGFSDKEDVWVDSRVIEPIPLTPEILEKNGWIYEDSLWLHEDAIILQKSFDSTNLFFWFVAGSPFLPINYVHELQHALKLCGIEKTIEL